MKNFLKDVLILLFIITIVSAFFSGIMEEDTSSYQKDISNEASYFEEKVDNNQVVDDGIFINNNVDVKKGNFIGQIGYIISDFIIMIINGIIRVIIAVISKLT